MAESRAYVIVPHVVFQVVLHTSESHGNGLSSGSIENVGDFDSLEQARNVAQVMALSSGATFEDVDPEDLEDVVDCALAGVSHTFGEAFVADDDEEGGWSY